jgi:hypothetical protein
MKDYGDASPQIVRVSANLVSPFSRSGLPTHPFDFGNEELEKGVNSSDVLRVTYPDEVPAIETK